MKSLLLIDANALIHRSFHALPPLTTPKGEPIGAIYGLARALMKTMKERKPDYVAAAFDRPEPTFRKKMFADYKAHRPPAADELISQIIKAHELFEKLNIKTFELPGFEADDIIGTFATKFSSRDMRVTILTGDMDTLQLVKGDEIVVLAPKKGIAETIEYNENAVRERFHLGPDQMTDYKGLVGDPSDNIPGVPGVGPKTAELALLEFGSIEGIYKKMSESHKLAKKLLPFKKEAFFSKELSIIHKEVPLKIPLADIAYTKPSDTLLDPYFFELGFQTLLSAEAKQKEVKEYNTPLELPFSSTKILVVPDIVFAKKHSKELQGKETKVAFDWKTILKGLEEDAKSIHPLFDIMIAAWLLHPDEEELSLEKITREVLHRDVGITEEEKKSILASLFSFFEKNLKEHGLVHVFEDIELPLIPVLASMEERGIAADTKTLSFIGTTMEGELNILQQKIYKEARGPFNINSPQQLADVLFNRLNIETETKRKTATGQRKTGKDILLELTNSHPVIPLILEYRETFKVRSGFVEPLRAAAELDGRVHTTYLQTGTGTGRLSSEKPNLQNIPQGSKWAEPLRNTFLASKGFTLLSFDYAQLELRLLAHITQDEALLSAFAKNDDIHSITASKVFGVPVAQVDSKMRRIGKTLNFGVVYGMGARAFSKTSGIPYADAQKFITEYFRAFPRVKQWQDITKEEVKKKGFIENVNGRKRWFAQNAAPGEFERAAINMPLQSLGADILKLAMIKSAHTITQNLTMKKNVFLLLSIHDELLFEVRDGAIPTVALVLKSIMESIYPLSVPLHTEMKEGKKWGTMKRI
ncbi:MAG: DNA polymerase [Candidatus Paceibacterota bacterium]|jgi:DNA polymerase-1